MEGSGSSSSEVLSHTCYLLSVILTAPPGVNEKPCCAHCTDSQTEARELSESRRRAHFSFQRPAASSQTDMCFSSVIINQRNIDQHTMVSLRPGPMGLDRTQHNENKNVPGCSLAVSPDAEIPP